MAFRPTSRVHAPSSRVEIDWSLPLARGLTGAWSFNGNFVDHVSGVAATQGSSSAFANTASGTQFKVDGSANGHITVSSANISTPALSIVSLFNPTTLGGGYVGLFANRGAGSVCQEILLKSSGKLAVYFWNGGGQAAYDGSGSFTLAAGKTYSVAATYNSASGLIGYVNGAQDGTFAGGTDLSTATTVANWGADSFDYTSRTLTGTIGPSALWNRALSAQEVAWLAAEPFALFRSTRRRLFYVASGSTVFFAGTGRSVSAGRTVNTQSTAIRATTAAGARLIAAQSPSTVIAGKTSSLAPGRALASPIAVLAARTQADAAGRATASPSAPLTARTEATAPGKAAVGLAAPIAARTEGIPSGRATTSLAAPLASKTQARARGQAVAGGVSQLSGSARTQGASAGRATGSAATSLSGRTAGATGGKAAAAPSAPLSGKAQAGSRASATAGGVSQLSALARTTGLAAGRAASSLGATVAGRTRGNGAAKASPSPSAAATARTQAGGRGAAFAGGVSLLFGSASTTGAAAGRAALSSAIVLAGKSAAKARGMAGLGATSPLSAAGATRGRAAGRAAITVSAILSASTISRGAMRSGLAAGTALVAVARSRAFGHAINGDLSPIFFDIGRVATIPADSRLAILPVDIRAVTISGST